ncbi:hypothetical protein NDU88_006455 [Pleurodeles waltl]|uniref:Uncharacterized protein n=1 Tax=Pleurodeles waltl TaxID=8319 RepID=A0AAV7WXM6_PLEWA|nr:hypothetical protein NDU88_006455 [Pleurodeles waltl]
MPCRSKSRAPHGGEPRGGDGGAGGAPEDPRTQRGPTSGSETVSGRHQQCGGSALPGDAEWSERSRLEDCGRPLSRGLECGVTPARSDASSAGARGSEARPPPCLHLDGGSSVVPGAGNRPGRTCPSLRPSRSGPERGNGADRRRGPEQQEVARC